MLIGEVSRRAGISARMLRHYDAIGLVSPTGRTVGGYREYSADDLRRLFHVESLRSLGMSLRDLQRALDDPDFTPSTLVEELVASTQQRIERDQELLRRLRHVQDGEPGEWPDVLRLIALMRGLESDDPLERHRNALGAAGDPDTAPPPARLLAERVLDESEVNVAGALRWALRRAPDAVDALDVLVPALGSDDPDRRLRAVLALADLDPGTGSADATQGSIAGAAAPRRAVTDALVAALGNPDAAVRAHAALTLGSRGDRLAIPELLAMIVAGRRDVDASDALARVADARDAHAEVIAAIADELARPGDEAAVPPLEVRLRLVQALAELRGPDAERVLDGLGADGERAVALTSRAILEARSRRD